MRFDARTGEGMDVWRKEKLMGVYENDIDGWRAVNNARSFDTDTGIAIAVGTAIDAMLTLSVWQIRRYDGSVFMESGTMIAEGVSSKGCICPMQVLQLQGCKGRCGGTW